MGLYTVVVAKCICCHRSLKKSESDHGGGGVDDGCCEEGGLNEWVILCHETGGGEVGAIRGKGSRRQTRREHTSTDNLPPKKHHETKPSIHIADKHR